MWRVRDSPVVFVEDPGPCGGFETQQTLTPDEVHGRPRLHVRTQQRVVAQEADGGSQQLGMDEVTPRLTFSLKTYLK